MCEFEALVFGAFGIILCDIFISTANVHVKDLQANQTVEVNQELRIHCIADGTDPEITWMIGEFSIDIFFIPFN